MKQSLTIVLLFLCSGQLFAQEKPTYLNDSLPVIKLKNEPRFYLNIHAGYAVGLGSTFKFYPDDITSIAVQQIENSPEAKNVKFKEQSKGLGEGFRFGAGISYIINDFVNVGIDLDYFKSTISKVRDSSYRRTQKINGATDEMVYNEKYKISYDATLLTLSPNITFKAISRPKFFIYNKVGAIVIFRPNSIQNEYQDGDYKINNQGAVRDSSAFNEKRYEWGIRNPAFGFMGGIGGQTKLTEKMRAFVEFQFTHVVFKVRNRILTNFKVDGSEMVNTLPLSEREITFKTSFSSDEVDGSPNKPTVAVYQRFPITYVGLQFGIAYRF